MRQIYLKLREDAGVFAIHFTQNMWYPLQQHCEIENAGYLVDDIGRSYFVDLNLIQAGRVWQRSTKDVDFVVENGRVMPVPVERVEKYSGICYVDGGKINRRFLP